MTPNNLDEKKPDKTEYELEPCDKVTVLYVMQQKNNTTTFNELE